MVALLLTRLCSKSAKGSALKSLSKTSLHQQSAQTGDMTLDALRAMLEDVARPAKEAAAAAADGLSGVAALAAAAGEAALGMQVRLDSSLGDDTLGAPSGRATTWYVFIRSALNLLRLECLLSCASGERYCECARLSGLNCSRVATWGRKRSGRVYRLCMRSCSRSCRRRRRPFSRPPCAFAPSELRGALCSGLLCSGLWAACRPWLPGAAGLG